MANLPVKRPKARLVEYVRPVRMKGLAGPTNSHIVSATVGIEYDEHFVTVTEEGKGSVLVPLSNVVRIEIA